MNSPVRHENRTLLRKLVVVAVLMFGFGWALVPLYRKICEVTGINVVTTRNPEARQAARNTQVDTTRRLVIEFDAGEVVLSQKAQPNSAAAFGISPRSVRLHVGLEGTEALWSDLEAALAVASTG